MIDFQDVPRGIWQSLVNVFHFLNDPYHVRPVVEIGVWAATIFFTMFFFIMLALKPRNRVDLGWTWLIGAVSLVLLRVVTVQYTDIRFQPIVALFIWANVTAAVVYTTLVYVNYKWHKWRLWKATRKAMHHGG